MSDEEYHYSEGEDDDDDDDGRKRPRNQTKTLERERNIAAPTATSLSVDCCESLGVDLETLKTRFMVADANVTLAFLNSKLETVRTTDNSPTIQSIARRMRGKEFDIETFERMLREASSRCLVCDKLLPKPSFRPGLCTSDACRFASMIGTGGMLEWEVANSPKVVDFLLGLFASTVQDTRLYTEETMKKFSLFELDPELKLRLSPSFKQRRDELILLSTDTAAVADPQLKTLLRRSIVATVPVVISHVPIPVFLATSATDVFLLQRHPLDEVRGFDEAQRVHGSFFVFSGSAASRWFPILHGGMKVLSNTPLQLNGAIHGAGIYSSLNLGVAAAYGPIVSILEVINKPGNLVFKSDRSIVVITDQTLVRVRVLLRHNGRISQLTVSNAPNDPTTAALRAWLEEMERPPKTKDQM